jgi:lactate dehydrogenase-like 2-hydroxyacid dehydrogenase
VVNTARGPIIDLDALLASLRDGHIAAAGLDVLPVEPIPDLLRAYRARLPASINASPSRSFASCNCCGARTWKRRPA